VLFTVVVLALSGYAWLALQVHRANRTPDSFELWSGAYSWIVGPKAEDLTKTASSRMQEGLNFLENSKLSGPERIADYRRSLETSEQLLIRSLRANPAQAEAITALVAARFELSPPATTEERERMLKMIDIASTMAPRIPRVQQQLGELLLALGLRDKALSYLGRAIELDPDRSRELIQKIRRYRIPLDQLLDALPKKAQTLAPEGGPTGKAATNPGRSG
jgi:tetratricopeptide (TPR) repeat protein